MSESTLVGVSMPRFAAHAARRRAAGRSTKLVARDRPDPLLWSLVLMHLTYVWRLPSVITPLKPLRLGLVSGIVALGLFLLDRSPRRRLIDVPTKPVRFAAGLMALMILSVPAGIYPTNSAQYLLQTVMPTMLLMLMLATSLRSLADVEWFALVNMASAAGYCIFVLWVFRVGRDGRLAELIYYDANDLGLLLVATLPFAGYFIARGQKLARRALAAFCLLVFLVLLVRTGSRGAFIGLLAVTIYLALSYRGLRRSARFGGVVFIGFAFVLLGGATYFSKMGTLLRPTQDYNWKGQSQTGRLEIWKRGLGYLADYPLAGIGVNNFSHAEGKLSAIAQEMSSRGHGFKWSVAHNSYLETAAEAGIGALVCFLGMFVATFYLLRRVVRMLGRLPYLSRELVLAQVLTAALIGYLVCAFFISAEYFVYPYVLLGMALGLAKASLSQARVVA